MKGLFPVSFRILGYVLLILSVFAPMVFYMVGMIDSDKSFVFAKLGMKFVVWISLFMIFLAKTRDEDNETSLLRMKAMKIALFIWGLYYIIALAVSAFDCSAQQADNSIGIYFMVMNVICFEFLQQKRKMDKKFNRKN